jgi:hypothetical protein
MSTRRAARSIIAATLALPPATVFEAVRQVTDFCPADVPGPHGAKRPSPLTVAWHVLAVLAALPVGQPVNRWSEGRAKGIRARAVRWSELVPMAGAVTITGRPPAEGLAVAASGLPLIGALERLFVRLLEPNFLDTVTTGRTGGPLIGKPGVSLSIHGGAFHSFATLRFRFRNGSKIETTYRHPADEDKPAPPLVVRLDLDTLTLIRLAAVARGIADAEAPDFGALPAGHIALNDDGSVPAGFAPAPAPPGIANPFDDLVERLDALNPNSPRARARRARRLNGNS